MKKFLFSVALIFTSLLIGLTLVVRGEEPGGEISIDCVDDETCTINLGPENSITKPGSTIIITFPEE